MNRAVGGGGRAAKTLRFVVITTSLGLAGCSAEVTGPKPEIKAPTGGNATLAVEPGIMCRDQITTTVLIHGDKFSPVPIHIPKDPKVALPTVTLVRSHELDGKAGDAAEIVWSGDPDKPQNLALLSWQGQQQLSFTVDQSVETKPGTKGTIPNGLYDIKVENPDHKSATTVGALAVVDKPSLSKLSPSIVCVAQGARDIELSGMSFLENGGALPTLEIEGVEKPLSLGSLTDCTRVAHDGIDAQLCNTAKITLPKEVVNPGFPALTLHNPETASCRSEDAVHLRVVPPPTIDDVKPSLACIAQGERAFDVHGTGYLEIDGMKPAVTIADKEFVVTGLADCKDLPTEGHTVRSCSTLSLTIAENAVPVGQPEVVVRNPGPAGCSVSNSAVLRIVPPPSVTAVAPSLVCLDDGAREVSVEGTDFLTVDGTVPAVSFDGVQVPAAQIKASDCMDLSTPGHAVQQCGTLVVTLAAHELPAGASDVKVTNPDPAGCNGTKLDALMVVPGPTLLSAAPSLVCTDDGAVPITLTGTGFLTIGSTLPTVTLNGAKVAVNSTGGTCVPVMASGLTVTSCTQLNVTAPQGSLAGGNVAIVATNPGPAGCAAVSNSILVAPPQLTLAAATPSNFCQGATGAQTITLPGQGFVRVNSTEPALEINNVATPITGFGSCTPLTVPGFASVQSCNSISFTYNLTGSEPVGEIPIKLTNPSPLTCNETVTSGLRIVSPPTVTGVTKADLCSDTLQTLRVTGTDFATGAQVLLGTDCNAATPTNCYPGTRVQVAADGKSLTADFASVPAGTYKVTVRNAASCQSTTATAIVTVHPTPLVFFVDPPIDYNHISLDATVFTSGFGTLSSSAQTVELVGANSATTALSFQPFSGKPNRLIATVPGIDSGTGQPRLAAGAYTVRVTSNFGCVGELQGGLTVTDTLAPALASSIAPSYVSKPTSTAVTVSGAGLLAGARVYLTLASGSGSARALTAVEVKTDGTALTAVVPAGLDAGTYNVVVVNPDGKVNVLSSGLHVVEAAPIITTMNPASLKAGDTQPVSVLGSGFKTGATLGLDCVLNGTHTTFNATSVTVNGDTSLTATINMMAGAGSICVVRVTNTDGSFFDYSAFSATTSSLNLSQWQAERMPPIVTPALGTPRRALSLVAGRPTAVSRYLYAIGGDNGVANTPTSYGSTIYDTVEAANVDVFGTMSAWSNQRSKLPSKRSGAGAATIGQFVYLAGGTDGSAAQSTLYRAQILNPLAGPEMSDLDATPGDGTNGLSKGLYYYRVAAVFPGNDASNPAGESLPGDVFPVQLPDFAKKIVLTLTWQPVTNAHGYRVYRSPTPDAALTSLALVGSVSCGAGANDLCNCGSTPSQCQIVDTGLGADASSTPLPAGSLGVWHAVNGARCTSGDCLMTSAREGLKVAAVADPTTSQKVYLYAFGGRDASGAYLNSYEVAAVTVNNDGTQTVADWAGGSKTITARADAGLWVINKFNTPAITNDDVWVYTGGGRTTGGANTQTVEAGKLGSNGDLGTFTNLTSLKGAGLTGFGSGTSNGQLYTFGGQTSANGESATACSGGTCPTLPNNAWNSLGSAAVLRMFMGATQESAFYFLAGGHDGVSTLSTTDQTVQ